MRLELTFFSYRPHCFSHVQHVVVMLTSPHLHEKDREVCIKTRSPPASLLLKGQVTDHTAVKIIKGLVSKETVVLHRWESCTQKFGFIDRVDNVN